MPFRREEALKTIIGGLSRLSPTYKLRGAIRLFDLNTISHELFCRVLNEVFDLQLIQMDRIQMGFPAIDLGDKKNRRAFQITTRKDSAKIQKTLDIYSSRGLENDFGQLQVLVLGEKQGSYRGLKIPSGIAFDPGADILDLKDLIKRIEELPTEKILRISRIVQEEIGEYQSGKHGARFQRLAAVALLLIFILTATLQYYPIAIGQWSNSQEFPVIKDKLANSTPSSDGDSIDFGGNAPLRFGQIEMETSLCVWEPIQRPYRVIAPLLTPEGVYWRFGGPPKGVPRDVWPAGSHQLFPALPGTKSAESRLEDPVFDITIVNNSSHAVVVSRLGIRPVAAWTSPKGPPFSGKIMNFDSFVLDVHGFKPGVAQWLILPEPIYVSPEAPYRLKLWLRDYCREVERNESAITIVVEANQELMESEEIYLGFHIGVN